MGSWDLCVLLHFLSPCFYCRLCRCPRWSFRTTVWCWVSTAAWGRISWASSTTSSRLRGGAHTPARRMRRPWSAACANPASCATSWAVSSWRGWPPGKRFALWWDTQRECLCTKYEWNLCVRQARLRNWCHTGAMFPNHDVQNTTVCLAEVQLLNHAKKFVMSSYKCEF